MKSGIYKIICTVNNKLYVGSSENLNIRKRTHFNHLHKNKHKNPHLQSAYNKYGLEGFEFIVIENCEIENLLEREQYWMDFYQCYIRDKGFNNCSKSDRPTGYKHTDNNRKKMSDIKQEMHKKGKLPNNLKRKPKGYKQSEDTIQKISISKIGNKNPMFGKKENEEAKKKRMTNMLATPRWNKGLTKEDDKRIEKLATWKGKLPPNAIKTGLINKETKDKWEANSIKELANKCPLSLASLNRLKSKSCSEKLIKKFEIYEC